MRTLELLRKHFAAHDGAHLVATISLVHAEHGTIVTDIFPFHSADGLKLCRPLTWFPDVTLLPLEALPDTHIEIAVEARGASR